LNVGKWALIKVLGMQIHPATKTIRTCCLNERQELLKPFSFKHPQNKKEDRKSPILSHFINEVISIFGLAAVAGLS
jgi:uncharacterized protein YggL (DUF469 family)